MRAGLIVALCAMALTAAGPAQAARGLRSARSPPRLLPVADDYFVKRGQPREDAQMPRGTDGKPIAARDYNCSNGFSPGQILVTLVPGLDLKRTGAAPVTDVGRSLRRRQAIVIDAKTGRRQLIWSELNSIPENPSKRTLNIHPGIGWREGHRYIVALRNLRRGNGRVIGRPRLPHLPRRVAVRSRRQPQAGPHGGHLPPPRQGRRAPRQPLSGLGLHDREPQGLTKRLLSIRDSFAQLGGTNLRDFEVAGGAPHFDVTEARPVSGLTARRVSGTVDVPCWLDQPGCPPGSRFKLDRRGLPVRSAGNVQKARFVCIVPASSATTPARALLFGHGLFQDETAVDDRPAGRRHERGDLRTTSPAWRTRTCQRRHGVQRPPRDDRRPPPARGSSTSCSSAGR